VTVITVVYLFVTATIIQNIHIERQRRHSVYIFAGGKLCCSSVALACQMLCVELYTSRNTRSANNLGIDLSDFRILTYSLFTLSRPIPPKWRYVNVSEITAPREMVCPRFREPSSCVDLILPLAST